MHILYSLVVAMETPAGPFDVSGSRSRDARGSRVSIGITPYGMAVVWVYLGARGTALAQAQPHTCMGGILSSLISCVRWAMQHVQLGNKHSLHYIAVYHWALERHCSLRSPRRPHTVRDYVRAPPIQFPKTYQWANCCIAYCCINTTTSHTGTCLVGEVSHQKNFHPSHRIFEHIHGTLNVDKKNKLITQFSWESRDESFKPSYSMISLKCYSNPHMLMTD